MMQCLISWLLTLVPLLLALPAIQANYRKFGFHNHDLCTKVRLFETRTKRLEYDLKIKNI